MADTSLFIQMSLTDLDKLIDGRLKTAGIDLINNVDMKGDSMKDVISTFKKNFLLYHPLTIKQCIFDTIDPMVKIVNKDNEIPPEYYIPILMITGIAEARNEVIAKDDLVKRFGDLSPYFGRLNSIFSKPEFAQIINASDDTLIEFQKAAEECRVDYARDRSVEKETIGYIGDFLEELSKEGSNKGSNIADDKMHEDKLFALATKATGPAAMDMYLQKRRGDIFGSPVDKLIMSYLRLISYWEVLHHAGYMKISLGEKETWVKFHQ